MADDPTDLGSAADPPGLAATVVTTLATTPGDHMRLDEESQQLMRRLGSISRRSGRLSPGRFNLTVSHGHRLVWFRVAKVATRSIFGHLRDTGVHLDVHHAMRIRYPTEAFADYFKFAFVRDPLDRFVSAWQDKVVDRNYFGFDEPALARMQALDRFAEWVAQQGVTAAAVDQHLALQSRLVDLTQVDFVGRLESFDVDFATVCQRLGLPERPAPRHHASRRPGFTPSPDVARLVADVYRLDYQILGYPHAGS